jgi:hypothetical protein
MKNGKFDQSMRDKAKLQSTQQSALLPQSLNNHISTLDNNYGGNFSDNERSKMSEFSTHLNRKKP